MKQVQFLSFAFLLYLNNAVGAVSAIHIGNLTLIDGSVDSSTQTRSLVVYRDRTVNVAPIIVALDDNWKLKDARLFHDKLVIVTTASNTYRSIIVNPKNGEVIDDCYGAFTELSPDGRYFVFMRWQGRAISGNSGYRVGETRIYDVTKSPEENRTNEGRRTLKSSSRSAITGYMDCGIPVYPQGDYNVADYGWVKSISNRKAPLSPYHWYANDRIIFAAGPRLDNQVDLVDISFVDNGPDFQLKSHKLAGKNFKLPRETEAPSMVFTAISKHNGIIELKSPGVIIRIPDFAKH